MKQNLAQQVLVRKYLCIFMEKKVGRVKNSIVCTYPELWQNYETTPCTCSSPVFPHFHSSILKKLQNHMECEVAGPQQET